LGPFQELVDFNSVKLGWRAVGMHLIGRSRFFRDDGQIIRVTVVGPGVLYLVLQK
jgi:hypothetical protein